LEKITNYKIRKITKVETIIVEEIQRRQLIWYGHVERIEDTRTPKQILKWTPTEKRKRGKPTATWTGGVEKARLVKQKRLEARNRKAQDAMKPASSNLVYEYYFTKSRYVAAGIMVD